MGKYYLSYTFVVNLRQWFWNCHKENNVLLVIIVNKTGGWGISFQTAQMIKQKELTYAFEIFLSFFLLGKI